MYISVYFWHRIHWKQQQQQRYTVTKYSTTHESNPMYLDKATYILPSGAAAICTQEKRIRLYIELLQGRGGKHTHFTIHHHPHHHRIFHHYLSLLSTPSPSSITIMLFTSISRPLKHHNRLYTTTTNASIACIYHHFYLHSIHWKQQQ